MDLIDDSNAEELMLLMQVVTDDLNWYSHAERNFLLERFERRRLYLEAEFKARTGN